MSWPHREPARPEPLPPCLEGVFVWSAPRNLRTTRMALCQHNRLLSRRPSLRSRWKPAREIHIMIVAWFAGLLPLLLAAAPQQADSSNPVDSVPAPSNIRGAEYPRVH